MAVGGGVPPRSPNEGEHHYSTSGYLQEMFQKDCNGSLLNGWLTVTYPGMCNIYYTEYRNGVLNPLTCKISPRSRPRPESWLVPNNPPLNFQELAGGGRPEAGRF